MSGSPSPVPLPPPGDFMADVRRLDSQANQNIKNQHVVSRVLLAQFAEPRGKKQEHQLAGLDLAIANSRPSYGGPGMFGKVPNFVRFASASVEQVWKETEDKLHDALNAVADNTIFGTPVHLDTIRDTFVLHFIRSIPAAFIHEDSWLKNRDVAKRFAFQFPQHLEEIFRQKHGIYPSGPEGFDLAFDLLIAEMTKEKDRGSFFRVGLEDKFRRYRNLTRSYSVEILIPEHGEFVIGDVPALSIRHRQTATGVRSGVGLATADELTIPLGSKWLAVLHNSGRSGFGMASNADVKRYNTMQVQAAYRHVHFRPGCGLEAWIRSIDRPEIYPPLPR